MGPRAFWVLGSGFWVSGRRLGAGGGHRPSSEPSGTQLRLAERLQSVKSKSCLFIPLDEPTITGTVIQ
eukprot:scaffold187608_cov23-Tisochrysis_lutea.AAC.1